MKWFNLTGTLIFLLTSCAEYEEMGLQAFAEKDFSSAEHYFDRALKYDPGNMSLIYNLARSRENLGKYKEAIQNYNEILLWDDMFLEANLGRARCQIELEEYKSAKYDLKKYLYYRPSETEALLLNGQCHMNLGNYNEAYTSLNKVLQMDKEDVKALYLLAVLEGRAGYFSASERLFKKTLGLSPGMARAYYGLATVYFMQKRYARALEYYEIAEDKGVEDVNIPINKGICYVKMNNLTSACRQFSHITDPQIKEKLRKKYCNM